jgi:hypothetical protein
MESISFKFDVRNSNPAIPLALEVHLDDQLLVSQTITDRVEINCSTVDLADGDHKFTLTMLGKTAEHTKLDAEGNIVSDAMLEFSNFKIEDIEVDELIQKLAVYHHDFNGSGASTQDEFYHSMGCNGTVTLEFTSPVYLWMLEHM